VDIGRQRLIIGSRIKSLHVVLNAQFFTDLVQLGFQIFDGNHQIECGATHVAHLRLEMMLEGKALFGEILQYCEELRKRFAPQTAFLFVVSEAPAAVVANHPMTVGAYKAPKWVLVRDLSVESAFRPVEQPLPAKKMDRVGR